MQPLVMASNISTLWSTESPIFQKGYVHTTVHVPSLPVTKLINTCYGNDQTTNVFTADDSGNSWLLQV